LVLSLLHMKREVLVVAIHVGCIGIWYDLINCDGTLDCFVLLIEDLGNIALELVTLRLHIFDGEANDCAAYLHCHRVLRLQPQLLLQQDDCSELGSIVLNVEAVMLALDDSVTATHTDVIDTHLALVSAAQLELGLLRRHCEQVNVSGRVLVERHGLQQYVVVFHVHLL
jgi:hypothetical protein